MSRPELDPNEVILAEMYAQGTWAGPAAGYRWWRMTIGVLTLTNRRLVFEPDQLYSFGLGQRWETPLNDLEGVKWLRPLEGDPPALLADRLVFYLRDGSEELFALFIRNDVRSFLDTLRETMIRVRNAAGQDVAAWEAPQDDDVDHLYDKRFILHRPWAIVLMLMVLLICLAALALNSYQLIAG